MKVFFCIFYPKVLGVRLEQVPRHSDVVVVVQCTAPDVSQDIAGFCQLVIQRMLAASSFRTLTTAYCHGTSLSLSASSRNLLDCQIVKFKTVVNLTQISGSQPTYIYPPLRTATDEKNKFIKVCQKY